VKILERCSRMAWPAAGAALVGLALGAAAALAQTPAPAAVPAVTPAPAVSATSASAPAATSDNDPVVLRAQLGVIYAQNGQHERARQEFVKLLEEPQGRAAALTDLGNLAFLDGQVEDALKSYQQAAALDSADPGILLNQGLAQKELGHAEEAEKAFASAVQMAGGVEKASYLLGLPTVEDTGRGKVSKMTADEVRQMLLKAKAGVPTTQAPAKTPESATKVTSRPGGARAADVSVGEQNLYWKDR
jgi:tetratricopeptide (TPR) repeat protein